MNSVILSQQLLLAIKTNTSSELFIQELERKPARILYEELMNENRRKIYWINLYNAFVQWLIQKQTPDFSNRLNRINFFSGRKINLSGTLLSLNDIEHGMLRNSSIWWSMGYLQKMMPSNFEKQLRVPLDYRIHFALNCGAFSCPAISFYSPDESDQQLNNAMKTFLDQEVILNNDRSSAKVSSIFKWYRGDFGGQAGIIQLISNHYGINRNQLRKLIFKPYDWNISPGNFSVL
ncbi:MAG: DUF547 domain-containing protein [Chitinophagales bacterium]